MGKGDRCLGYTFSSHSERLQDVSVVFFLEEGGGEPGVVVPWVINPSHYFVFFFLINLQLCIFICFHLGGFHRAGMIEKVISAS